MTEPTAARVALADRVHFTGRHDGVDPSPGPSSCADTDCMTLRRLIDEVERLTTELEQANFDRSRLQEWFDTAKAELEEVKKP